MEVNPRSQKATCPQGRTMKSRSWPMEAVGEKGGLNLELTRSIAGIGSGYTEFDDGDVLVAKITPCFENGKGACASGLLNKSAFGTTELLVLRGYPALDCRFLFYATVSQPFRSTGAGEMYGAGGQKRVPPEFCENYQFQLPSPAEQRTIADFLDRVTAKIDSLVATKRTLIERLKEKRTALISRTVTRGLPPNAAAACGLDPHPKLKPTGIDWLGEAPEHWEVKPLGRLVRFAGGATPDKGKPEYWDGDIPWVSPKDMKRMRIDDVPDHVTTEGLSGSALTLMPAQSVLIVVRGMILAHSFPVAITDAPVTINQDMKALTSGKRLNAEFLLWLLTGIARVFVSLAGESAHGTRKLDSEIVARICVALPSTNEQISIVDFLDRETAKLDTLVTKIETAIERLQEYRTALITAAVTGKIDVRKRAA